MGIKAISAILWIIRIYMIIVVAITLIGLSLLLTLFNLFAFTIHGMTKVLFVVTKWTRFLILKCLEKLE